MVHRPLDMNTFEFIRVASLRTAQLMRGCRALVPESHRCMLTAQMEVAAGKIGMGRIAAAHGVADPDRR